jgi:putative transposase
MNTELVLDALEQALHGRRPDRGLIQHTGHGSQYLSIRYTERLAENGVEASVCSVGESYDNALAETIIGFFKTEVIYARGPWRSLEAVEYATLESRRITIEDWSPEEVISAFARIGHVRGPITLRQ